MSSFSEPPVIANATKSLINLLRGWPNPWLLPKELLHKGANCAFSDPAVIVPGLLYPPDAGFKPLRENIASWLTGFFRPPTPIGAERITITGGASQSLGCILQVYTDPAFTRNAWFVVPCYMLAFRIFDDAGLSRKMRGVPEDDEGLDIEYLRREIRKSDDEQASSAAALQEQEQEENQSPPRYKPDRPWGKLYRHVIYTVPTFSNPSSKTMSLRRREQLVRLARETDALVVCDDVYDFLQWPASTASTVTGIDTAVLPRVVDVDRFLDGGAEREGADGFGNVISNGSFSKLAGPGLRTGWVEGTEKMAFGVSQW
jgi:DNA-binding transcriptional MocR family regulator